MGEDRLAGADHMRRVDVVADHLQRKVGFHARRDVEGAVLEERPAAMLALAAAQINGDLAFELGVHRLGAEMAHQHIFGRDRGVGLELEAPMAVRLAVRQQGALGALNARLQRLGADGGKILNARGCVHIACILLDKSI